MSAKSYEERAQALLQDGSCSHEVTDTGMWRVAHCVDCLAAALSEVAREARREALDEAVNAACDMCKNGFPPLGDDGWHDFQNDSFAMLGECAATEIRTLRDKEAG